MLDKKQENKKMNISLRGRVFTGTVVSTKMSKTITVEWERRRKIPKYERYERRKTRIHAHLPEGNEVEVGDIVRVMETRPISKTKHFIFVEKVTKEEKKVEDKPKDEEKKVEEKPKTEEVKEKKKPIKKVTKKKTEEKKE